MTIEFYDFHAPPQPQAPRRQKGWTTDQIATLRAEYGITPHDELAAYLGRTVRAMQKVAAENGISAWANRRARDEAQPRRGWFRRIAA